MLNKIKKNKIKIISSVIILLLIILIVTIKIVNKNNDIETYTENEQHIGDIPEYSEEFMENYFEEMKSSDSDEEKDNMLIVISSSKIENTYGAKKVIEAPNNQYILQYESTEEKEKAFSELKNDKSISSVEENIVYKTCDTEFNSWGVEKMALDHAINSSKLEILSNVTVAIIDTGCDMSLFNKYYGGKILQTYNVLEDSTTSMVDENGHGTHIAGTIAEATTSNVKILPVKVSRNGSMYNTDIITAINYITYNKKADVINMSFGSYYYSEAIEQAINEANNSGIICVAAAGNDNTNKRHYPSSLNNTISIASIDSELKKSSFSNYGSDITFTAPGTKIKSLMGKDAAISKNNGNTDGDNDHETISGTSMATPHAVSAVAMLKSYNKDLTLDDIIEVLKLTSVDLGEEGWDEYFGYGLISFSGVEFREDDVNTDKYKVYKNSNNNIANIELLELKFTPYNYYSLTNIMASRIRVHYVDNTVEEKLLWELPNLEVLNYIPTAKNKQIVTINTGNVSINVDVVNPSNYESGWEYNFLVANKINIIGYKSHGLNIGRLYIPETINSVAVTSINNNLRFNNVSNDFSYYVYLYLPKNFKRIGNYSFSNTKIKYIYGESNGIEIGSHAFESSSIISVDVTLTKIEDNAFKNDLDLIYVNVSNLIDDIGNYAFYNCQSLVKVGKVNDDDYNNIDRIGKYAFYNCILLSKFELRVFGDIEEYAFYNCMSLITFDLYQVDAIGSYSFYGSGISEAELGLINEVKESSFENCINLKSVSFTSGKIESRAFWNSGVEEVSIGSLVDYIAEDAFAYCPIKNCDGGCLEGNYYCMADDGIIENATNKLVVGFRGSLVAGSTKIPNFVTEIGNYAFTGNNTVQTIIIPENVTKIGEYAFKDCYNLSSVYILGSNIEFGNDAFVKTYNGEIENSELYIYIHKDSSNTRQCIKNNNLEYRNIEPDEIIVIDNKKVYRAYDEIDEKDLLVKLIYHEEKNREEMLSEMNFSKKTVLTNKSGVGFQKSSGTIYYGDTYYTLQVRNIHGYEESFIKVEIEVIKATPQYKVPTNLTGHIGQKLSEIALPNHFEWMNSNEIINEAGDVTCKARYIPTDTENYEIVENIDIIISVENTKTVINPNISVMDKTYDGTTQINKSNISVSNLDSSEYSIVSAKSSSASAGNRTAKIKLRLSDEKYEEYSFDNGKQEKEFEVAFKINKANIKYSASNRIYRYDEQFYGIEIVIESPANATIKYANENDEYVLDEMPKYNEIGTYTIKYKIYVNNNYTEVFGENTLIIVKDYVLGDINGDGKVSLLDYGLVLAHVKRTKLLEGEQLQRADVNMDGKVTLVDYGLILAHVKRTKLLF